MPLASDQRRHTDALIASAAGARRPAEKPHPDTCEDPACGVLAVYRVYDSDIGAYVRVCRRCGWTDYDVVQAREWAHKHTENDHSDG